VRSGQKPADKVTENVKGSKHGPASKTEQMSIFDFKPVKRQEKAGEVYTTQHTRVSTTGNIRGAQRKVVSSEKVAFILSKSRKSAQTHKIAFHTPQITPFCPQISTISNH
jgi:hypothetical protein